MHKKIMSNEKFLARIHSRNENIEPLEKYKGHDVKIKFRCKICDHVWSSTPENIYNGHGCPECGKRRSAKLRTVSNDTFLERLHSINSNIIPLDPYIRNDLKIRCRCAICFNEWSVTPDGLLHGRGCPKCANAKKGSTNKKDTSTFIEQMKAINPDINIMGEYLGAFEKIECRCVKHNLIFFSHPTHLLEGKSGCYICRSEKISNALCKTNEQFIEEMKAINPSINILGEYHKTSDRVQVQCAKCGHIWSPVAGSLMSGFGCPRCSSSKGEIAISELLTKRGIKYDSHVRYSDLRGVGGKKHLPLSYDFYLPDYNLLIEYQGQFHDHTAPLQTDDAFKIQQKHDELKRNYAKDHGINLLEIWYYNYDNIEKILMECINSLENPVTTTAV